MSRSIADLMTSPTLQPMPSHDWTGWVPPPPMQPMASHVQPGTWDTRADGSPKGTGYLGVLARPDGRVSNEINIGVNLNGKAIEIPTLVPTLTPQEVNYLLTMDVSKGQIPDAIVQKAVDFARQRMKAGKPVFAQPGEDNTALYPHVKRAR